MRVVWKEEDWEWGEETEEVGSVGVGVSWRVSWATIFKETGCSCSKEDGTKEGEKRFLPPLFLVILARKRKKTKRWIDYQNEIKQKNRVNFQRWKQTNNQRKKLVPNDGKVAVKWSQTSTIEMANKKSSSSKEKEIDFSQSKEKKTNERTGYWKDNKPFQPPQLLFRTKNNRKNGGEKNKLPLFQRSFVEQTTWNRNEQSNCLLACDTLPNNVLGRGQPDKWER